MLAKEPDNPVLLAKLGALLARTKRPEEAGRRFLAAAQIYERQAFDDKALATYVQAAALLPGRADLCERIARLDANRGRKADAIRALVDGAARQRGRKRRPDAIRLLREAVKIEPGHLEATLELARLLRKQGERSNARKLYAELCARKHGAQLRRARAAWFRMSPTPVAAWLWLRAAVSGS